MMIYADLHEQQNEFLLLKKHCTVISPHNDAMTT